MFKAFYATKLGRTLTKHGLVDKKAPVIVRKCTACPKNTVSEGVVARVVVGLSLIHI